MISIQFIGFHEKKNLVEVLQMVTLFVVSKSRTTFQANQFIRTTRISPTHTHIETKFYNSIPIPSGPERNL